MNTILLAFTLLTLLISPLYAGWMTSSEPMPYIEDPEELIKFYEARMPQYYYPRAEEDIATSEGFNLWQHSVRVFRLERILPDGQLFIRMYTTTMNNMGNTYVSPMYAVQDHGWATFPVGDKRKRVSRKAAIHPVHYLEDLKAVSGFYLVPLEKSYYFYEVRKFKEEDFRRFRDEEGNIITYKVFRDAPLLTQDFGKPPYVHEGYDPYVDPTYHSSYWDVAMVPHTPFHLVEPTFINSPPYDIATLYVPKPWESPMLENYIGKSGNPSNTPPASISLSRTRIPATLKAGEVAFTLQTDLVDDSLPFLDNTVPLELVPEYMTKNIFLILTAAEHATLWEYIEGEPGVYQKLSADINDIYQNHAQEEQENPLPLKQMLMERYFNSAKEMAKQFYEWRHRFWAENQVFVMNTDGVITAGVDLRPYAGKSIPVIATVQRLDGRQFNYIQTEVYIEPVDDPLGLDPLTVEDHWVKSSWLGWVDTEYIQNGFGYVYSFDNGWLYFPSESRNQRGNHIYDFGLNSWTYRNQDWTNVVFHNNSRAWLIQHPNTKHPNRWWYNPTTAIWLTEPEISKP